MVHFPLVFTPSSPITYDDEVFTQLAFTRRAGLSELAIHRRYKDEPRRAICAVLGQLAGVPQAIVDGLSDVDFVRLEAETRPLFASR